MAQNVQQIKTAHAFAKQGAKVTFLYPSTDSSYHSHRLLADYDLSPLKTLNIYQVTVKNQKGIAVKLLPYCISGLLKKKYDIVYTRNGLHGTLLWPLIQIAGAKLIMEIHFLNNPNKKRKGHLKNRIANNISIFLCDGIVTITDFFARFLVTEKRISSERICKARCSTYAFPAKPKPETIPEKIHLVYTGSLHPTRGIDILIEGLNMLSPETKNIIQCNIIGGKAEQVDAIKRFTEELGDERMYRFSGFVPHKYVKDMLNDSHLAISPLKNTFFGVNLTSPVKIFEYMSARLPIVCSDLPTNREILDESTCFFFNPDDPETLAEKIVWITKNWPEAVNRAEKAYKRFLEFYTFDKRAEKILFFIDTVPKKFPSIGRNKQGN